jgi:hypothetical protein
MAVFTAYAKEAGVACTVDQGRIVGAKSGGAVVYEIGCAGVEGAQINKAASADTASLVFQTGFSGRAEMGLAGGMTFPSRSAPMARPLPRHCRPPPMVSLPEASPPLRITTAGQLGKSCRVRILAKAL